MEKEGIFADYNEEQQRFVDRYTDIGIVGVVILWLWQMYLGFVHQQWQDGLIEYYIFYALREYTPLVGQLVNVLFLISGFLLIFVGIRSKYVKHNNTKPDSQA